MLVDYAHSPDALRRRCSRCSPSRASAAAAAMVRVRLRRQPRRPQAPGDGRDGQRLADRVVLTSDNPRDESPAFILSQILAGVVGHDISSTSSRPPRRHPSTPSPAPAAACVIVAGKGHEDYQEVGGLRHPFRRRRGAGRAGARAARGRCHMTMMTLGDAQALLPGSTLAGRPARRSSACTATRAQPARRRPVRRALVGEASRRARLRRAGARRRGTPPRFRRSAQGRHRLGRLPGLVDDTRRALGELARGSARAALPLVAVTSSNGKTTVTQMIASHPARWRGDAALATLGNLQQRHRRAADRAAPAPGAAPRHVVELGMNHPGEIAQLAAIAQPTVALVNNAQREHQEFMVSVEAVARENGAVIEALPADGTAVFPADEVHASLWRARRRAPGAHASRPAARPTCAATGWSDAGYSAPRCTPRSAACAGARGGPPQPEMHRATACAVAAGYPLAAIARAASEPSSRWPAAQLKRVPRRRRSDADARRRQLQRQSRFRCVPRSTCWPSCRRRAGWCLATWARSGDRGPKFPPRGRRLCARARHQSLWRPARCAPERPPPSAARRAVRRRRRAAAALPRRRAPASTVVKDSRFMKMERVVARSAPAPSAAGVHAMLLSLDTSMARGAVARAARLPARLPVPHVPRA